MKEQKLEIFKGEYNGIAFEYHRDGEEGVLTTTLKNGVVSTHKLKNWAITRVMQFIESMTKLV